MAAIGDVYQIIDTQEMDGQKVLNVYFYTVTLSVLGADASDAAAAYIDQVLPLVAALQVSSVVHTSVKAQNLYHVSDVHEELISVPGGVTDDPMGTFEAIAIREIGDNGAVRGGAKRIAGIGESETTEGVITNVPFIDQLNDLCFELATTMLWGALDGGTMAPVIVKRILDAGNYRLPTNSGEAILSTIVDALFTPLVSSQNTRKVGRGE